MTFRFLITVAMSGSFERESLWRDIQEEQEKSEKFATAEFLAPHRGGKF